MNIKVSLIEETQTEDKWTIKLKTNKQQIFLVYSDKRWCLCGTHNGLYWETDDFDAETKKQALEGALDYIRDTEAIAEEIFEMLSYLKTADK